MTTSPYTTRTVSHEEAGDVARRLIAGCFRRDGERLDVDRRPRLSIPTRPNDDDDCLLLAYIEQQERSMNRLLESVRSYERMHEAIIEAMIEPPRAGVRSRRELEVDRHWKSEDRR